MSKNSLTALFIIVLVAFVGTLSFFYKKEKDSNKYLTKANEELKITLKDKNDEIESLQNHLGKKSQEILEFKKNQTVKKEEISADNKMLEKLLSQYQENLILQEEIKLINEKISDLINKCEVKPKVVAKPKPAPKKVVRNPYYVPKSKPVEKPVVKEKKEEPKIIINNNITIKDQNQGEYKGKTVSPRKYYPNDNLN